MNLKMGQDDPRVAVDVIAAARDRLRRCPYLSVQKVACEYVQGTLFLRGWLPSFYHKQMAQEAVVDLQAIAQVVNEIEVAA